MEFFSYKMSFRIRANLLRFDFFLIKVTLFHATMRPKQLMSFKEKMVVFYDNLSAIGR